MSHEFTPHLKVVQHPNPKMRTFHVVREVGDIRHMYGFGKEGRVYYSGLDEDPGEEAKTLARRLTALPGVTGSHMRSYQITVSIADAFSWRDVGPLVIGEIVRSLYPEVDGKTLEVSISIGWSYYVRPGGMGFMDEDDGHRSRYQDTVERQPVEVNLGGGRPHLDLEHLLDKDAMEKAKELANRETIIE